MFIELPNMKNGFWGNNRFSFIMPRYRKYVSVTRVQFNHFRMDDSTWEDGSFRRGKLIVTLLTIDRSIIFIDQILLNFSDQIVSRILFLVCFQNILSKTLHIGITVRTVYTVQCKFEYKYIERIVITVQLLIIIYCL